MPHRRGTEEAAREAQLADARPAFEQAEYADRQDRLRRAMSEAGIDVVLLSRPESMCWLHGYTARWYRHAGPAEWPSLATSVVRADRDEVIHFDFGAEEELLAATSACRDVRIFCAEARPGRQVDDVGKAMKAWQEDSGISQIPSWCGGYDLGLAFPPDWVGPWKFDFDEPEPGKVFEAGMVTNLECLFGTLLVDTIIYAESGNRVLSTVPRELLVATP